jgi:3-oxoacyl-[acyl-carrier-protein] synthase II
MQPFDWVRGCVMEALSRRNGDPTTVLRPFDADRTGEVRGEGAAAFVLESRQHAEARGANLLARVRGTGSSIEFRNGKPLQGHGISRAMLAAIRDAGMQPDDIGHVNAQGASTLEGDRLEAAAIREILGEVAVTAPKSFFGNLGAASGAVEMAASVLGLASGIVPVTLNYVRPDPACPVRVVHSKPAPIIKPTAMLLNQTAVGQCAAVIIERV